MFRWIIIKQALNFVNTAGTFMLRGSGNETKNVWTQRKLELYMMSNEREAYICFYFPVVNMP